MMPGAGLNMAKISKQDLEEFKSITKEMRGLEFPSDELAMRAAQNLVRLFEQASKQQLESKKDNLASLSRLSAEDVLSDH